MQKLQNLLILLYLYFILRPPPSPTQAELVAGAGSGCQKISSKLVCIRSRYRGLAAREAKVCKVFTITE